MRCFCCTPTARQRRRQAPDYEEGEPWAHVLLDATAEPEAAELETAEAQA